MGYPFFCRKSVYSEGCVTMSPYVDLFTASTAVELAKWGDGGLVYFASLSASMIFCTSAL